MRKKNSSAKEKSFFKNPKSICQKFTSVIFMRHISHTFPSITAIYADYKLNKGADVLTRVNIYVKIP